MITIKIDGLDRLEQRLSNAAKNLGGALKSRDFLIPAGALLVNAAKKRIDETLSPPLNPDYKKQKTAKGYSPKPLIRTIGRRSINFSVESGRLWIGLAKHMAIHNQGYSGSVTVSAHRRKGRRGKKSVLVKSHSRRINIPRREFLGILKANEDKTLTRFLSNALRKQLRK